MSILWKEDNKMGGRNLEKRRVDHPLIVKIYLIVLLLIDFFLQYKYIFASDYKIEKFYLSCLIIASMMTIVYTVWFFDLLEKEGK